MAAPYPLPPFDEPGAGVAPSDVCRLSRHGYLVLRCMPLNQAQGLAKVYLSEMSAGVEFVDGAKGPVPWPKVCSARMEISLPTAYNCASFAAIMNAVAVPMHLLARAARARQGRMLAGPVIVGDSIGSDVPFGPPTSGHEGWTGFINIGLFALVVTVDRMSGDPVEVVVPGGCVFVRRPLTDITAIRGSSLRVCFAYTTEPPTPFELSEAAFVISNGAVPRFWHYLHPVPIADEPEVVDPLVMAMGMYMSRYWVRSDRLRSSLHSLYALRHFE